MTATTTIEQPAGGGLAWYALSAQDVTRQMGVDADDGLTVAEVERRQAEYGPNELPAIVAIDKIIQLRRQSNTQAGHGAKLKARPAIQATTTLG